MNVRFQLAAMFFARFSPIERIAGRPPDHSASRNSPLQRNQMKSLPLSAWSTRAEYSSWFS